MTTTPGKIYITRFKKIKKQIKKKSMDFSSLNNYGRREGATGAAHDVKIFRARIYARHFSSIVVRTELRARYAWLVKLSIRRNDVDR